VNICRRYNERTTTIAEFREAVLDPAKRRHYQLRVLSTVDHKRIAVLYMLTALVFFVIGGTEALFIRLQLIVPNNHFLSPTRSTNSSPCTGRR